MPNGKLWKHIHASNIIPKVEDAFIHVCSNNERKRGYKFERKDWGNNITQEGLEGGKVRGKL